jgi:hypothetical protein
MANAQKNNKTNGIETQTSQKKHEIHCKTPNDTGSTNIKMATPPRSIPPRRDDFRQKTLHFGRLFKTQQKPQLRFIMIHNVLEMDKGKLMKWYEMVIRTLFSFFTTSQLDSIDEPS